ncbi:CDP-glycerol glycerophosphotransferase family protein [Arthrobacter sp. AQ5-05]|uniref:CDP-glycerol glycerophosphotransferase family protein n=1 Tax=Arthrobacter sp. AQ5-05 TaxID=2184581 RepID=UPI0011BDE745|nr:CDP-glycerol glycerophosphotransferase family protein [Arthrobacter sp. AQ5-05]
MAVEKKVSRTLSNTTPAPTAVVEFAVFFADGPSQSYQLEQWVAPFEALQKRGYGVCLLVMNALTARKLNRQTNLPILLTRSMEQIETALASWNTLGIFYVNNSQANFTMLRFNGPAHIHLSHGESEKSSMVSNQLKAYDFAFIAGLAARRRIMANVARIDPAKLIEIGRPQLDVQFARPAALRTNPRIRVLYAPTWEGDGQNMAYSSIVSIGAKLVTALLSDERFTVVFRPHPKTGSSSVEARHELGRIRKAITTAIHRTPDAGHFVDRAVDSSLSIYDADIVLCDISAMAMDSVGLNKPLMLLYTFPTTMTDDLAIRQSVSTQDASRMLAEENGNPLLSIIATLSKSEPPQQQQALRDVIFGDPALGSATERFIDATLTVTSAADRP